MRVPLVFATICTRYVGNPDKIVGLTMSRSPSVPGRKHKLKAIGTYQLVQLLDAVEAFSLALSTRVLEWSNDQR
jgi:hypothetical protein